MVKTAFKLQHQNLCKFPVTNRVSQQVFNRISRAPKYVRILDIMMINSICYKFKKKNLFSATFLHKNLQLLHILKTLFY